MFSHVALFAFTVNSSRMIRQSNCHYQIDSYHLHSLGQVGDTELSAAYGKSCQCFAENRLSVNLTAHVP